MRYRIYNTQGPVCDDCSKNVGILVFIVVNAQELIPMQSKILFGLYNP